MQKRYIVKLQEINETVFVKIAYSGGHLTKANVECIKNMEG